MSMAVIGVAGVVVGAGAGIYSATQAGKGSGQSRSLGEVGQMPIDDYKKQLRALSKEQFRNNDLAAQQALSLYPEFGAAEREQQRLATEQQLSLYPKYAKAERAATSAQHGSDLADYGKYGSLYGNALGNMSSGYRALDGTVDEARNAPDLMNSLSDQALNVGNSELRDALQASALSDLKLGGELNPEQIRNAAQSSRAAWSDRGLLYSTPAAASEILNRDSYSQALLAARRAAAGSAWQVGATEDVNNQGFRLNVGNLLSSDRGNRANTILAAGQAQLQPILGSLNSRTAMNPYGLLGSMAAPSTASVGQIIGTAPQVTGASNAIQPLYNYGKDVFDTNFNAAESRANASANAYASVGSGLTSAGGSLYGSSMRRAA